MHMVDALTSRLVVCRIWILGTAFLSREGGRTCRRTRVIGQRVGSLVRLRLEIRDYSCTEEASKSFQFIEKEKANWNV